MKNNDVFVLDNKAQDAVRELVGGGSNPLEVVTGRKLTVDLSSEVLDIISEDIEYTSNDNGTDIAIGVYYDADSHGQYDFARNRVYKSGYDDETAIRVLLFPNEQNNQLLMSFIGRSAYYMTLNQPIVVYEGDVTGLSDTSSILDQLPTITVTLNEDDFTNLEYLDIKWYGIEGAHKVFTYNNLMQVTIHVDIE